MTTNYKQFVESTIIVDKTFIRATFTGGTKQWRKVIVRPVIIKNKQHIQFSYFDNKKDITKNYSGFEVNKKLQELFSQKCHIIILQTKEKTFQIHIPTKGKAIIHEHQPVAVVIPTSHDRKKDYIIPSDVPLPFLQMLGMMNKDGSIAADKQHKFQQINQFLKLMQQTIPNNSSVFSQLRIVDFGCGSGYLTLAIYYYFNEIRKIPTEVVGVDSNKELMQKLSEQAKELDWQNISFSHTTIKEFRSADPIDISIALHACDTATDDALAQAIRNNSTYIFSSPCCHHQLQTQLQQAITPSIFSPVFRYPIFAERFGDILTDTFRALILQIMGYKTDIIEFISPEHTSKNTMIRAVKSDSIQKQKYINEYTSLKKYWKVRPYLETLLGSHFTNSL